jgi:hypothetical protein
MADTELARLIEAAAAAASLHFDLSLSGLLRSFTTHIGPTHTEITAIVAADASCIAANGALAAYRLNMSNVVPFRQPKR